MLHASTLRAIPAVFLRVSPLGTHVLTQQEGKGAAHELVLPAEFTVLEPDAELPWIPGAPVPATCLACGWPWLDSHRVDCPELVPPAAAVVQERAA